MTVDVEVAPEAAEGHPAPVQGQLVTVRNRVWVAADVKRGSVASDDPAVATGRAPHLVTLVSVEDDAYDEELRVVWELEPGATAHDQHALPSPGNGFDDPAQLDAFLDAVRWGAIASADRTALQAPFRAGIQLEDYQLDPVVRALSMPRTNLLIADDVGLGKTVEAGLVMQELMLRHRARSMLIVCPASLTVQWHDEMRDKFGLDFRIVDAALLRRLRRERGLYANPWTHYPRLIVSVDWLKRDRPMRLLREVLPAVPRYPRAIDLLVVDEVHTCAPSGTGRYAVDSQRTAAIRTLAPHCEHRLFLSATPHNGYLESFTALLELLDDQRPWLPSSTATGPGSPARRSWSTTRPATWGRTASTRPTRSPRRGRRPGGSRPASTGWPPTPSPAPRSASPTARCTSSGSTPWPRRHATATPGARSTTSSPPSTSRRTGAGGRSSSRSSCCACRRWPTPSTPSARTTAGRRSPTCCGSRPVAARPRRTWG